MPRKKINPSEEPEQTAAMEAEQPGMDAPATLEGPPQDMGAPDNGLPMEMGEQGEIPPMPGDEPTLPGENGGGTPEVVDVDVSGPPLDSGPEAEPSVELPDLIPEGKLSMDGQEPGFVGDMDAPPVGEPESAEARG